MARLRSTSWRIDETYEKVRGQWAYLYRALVKHENTIDFYLSPTRNTAAAKRFLGKALKRPEGLGETDGHQHRQGADLRRRSDRAEEGGQMSLRRRCTGRSNI